MLHVYVGRLHSADLGGYFGSDGSLLLSNPMVAFLGGSLILSYLPPPHTHTHTVFTMVSKKGKGGGKGKGPAPKGKGKPAPKRPAPAPSSSSEDELDADQRGVLDQLLAMEHAQGIDQGPPWQADGGPSGREPQCLKQQMFTSEVLNWLAVHSQPQQCIIQQPIPPMLEVAEAMGAEVSGSSAAVALAHGDGSHVRDATASSAWLVRCLSFGPGVLYVTQQHLPCYKHPLCRWLPHPSLILATRMLPSLPLSLVGWRGRVVPAVRSSQLPQGLCPWGGWGFGGSRGGHAGSLPHSSLP